MRRTKKARSSYRSDELGSITETSLKLFLSLLVSSVAIVSLSRLLSYHSAQSEKLREVRAQVKETEYRVGMKSKQLQRNFDSSQIESLMEEHSSRISKDRVRVFLQEKTAQ